MKAPAINARLWQTLVENAPHSILLIDGNQTVIFCNKRATQMFGSAADNPCGKSIAGLLAEGDEKLLKEKMLELSQKASASFTMSFKDRNGPRVLDADMNAFEATDGKIFAIFLHDATLRQKAEEEKEAMDRQLRAVYKMEAVGQLARGIAHDLNNSLGAISGYIDLIKRLVSNENEKITRYTAQIASATQRSTEIIRKLLTFARKGQMQIMSFDLNSVINETIKLLESSLGKSVVIGQDLQAKDGMLVGDPGQIQNAIVNLAINARDAMPEGGSLTFKTWNIFIDEPAAKSRPYKMTAGYYFCLSLTDTGVGMDREILNHLFEPFFTTKEFGRGTGLGLASVYGSVKSHHGYIEVDSTVKKGSTFTLFLPVNRSAAVEAEEGPAADLVRKLHIMVVDHDRPIAEMLVELLSWLGYSASLFTKADEAVSFYSRNSGDVDLVIAENNMPDLDGSGLFAKLRGLNPGVRMLVSAGYCLEEERHAILQLGIKGLITKPFMSAELSKAVADALA